jgi:hypothetical protein
MKQNTHELDIIITEMYEEGKATATYVEVYEPRIPRERIIMRFRCHDADDACKLRESLMEGTKTVEYIGNPEADEERIKDL